MTKKIKQIGIDVHKSSLVLATADSGSRKKAKYIGTID